MFKRNFCPKKFGSRKFVVQNIFGSIKILGLHNFRFKNILGSKKFGSEKFLGPKWINKFFDRNKFWAQNNFGIKKLGVENQKISLVKQMFWSKRNFDVQKYFGSKKDSDPE